MANNNSSDDEWVVEYQATCEGVKSRHLSVLIAEHIDDVQKVLLKELEILYPGSSPVEVTILTIKKANDVMDDFGVHSLFTE